MFNNAEYVFEVYKERSFSKAAQNLYISQPALSVAIKRIEARIGEPLFDRSTNPVGLTECGQKYVEVVRQMMDLKDNFINYLNDLQELKTGVIHVGGSNLFTSCILPPIITEFNRRYPRVEISVTEANTPLLDEKLMDGTLDLILDNYIFDASTHASRLYRTEQLLLAVPASFPVCEKLKAYQISREAVIDGSFQAEEVAPAPIKTFEKLPFILLKAGNDTRDRALRIFSKNGMLPNIGLNLDQQMTSYNVCRQGLGISFVSDTLIRSMPADTDVVFFKLDPTLSARNVCFFYKKARYVTRAMEEFLNMAAEF